METGFLIVVLSATSLLLLFLLVRSRKLSSDYSQHIESTTSAFNQLQTAHLALEQELSEAKDQLQRISEDPVTQLLGWQLFEDRLTQSIKESERYQLTMGVLFVDIDDFKVINDALDYEIGNTLLLEVAKRLQTCIRQVDSISRFSKDTFVILLGQLSKPEAAVIIAQRILQTLTPPFLIKEHELYITACVGIATFPLDGQDAQTLLRSGDHALHLAKKIGKHSYQFYQERLHVKSQRELALYTSLSNDGILDELVLYYQPIINVANGEIVCMDALVHWQHAEFGLINAQELFDLMERQHKSHVITEWLIYSACKQFLRWQSLGFSPALLSIPLSLKQFENNHFIYRIQQILQELEFKPEWLLLEMREGSESLSFEAMEKAFNMLNYLGVKIAVDHFGASLFSLRHLKNFAIHYLKLDPLLVEDIHVGANDKTRALLQSLLLFAQNMSMQVIVQGVESETQVAVLKELGCGLMQGSLVGEPLPAGEVVSKLVPLA